MLCSAEAWTDISAANEAAGHWCDVNEGRITGPSSAVFGGVEHRGISRTAFAIGCYFLLSRERLLVSQFVVT